MMTALAAQEAIVEEFSQFDDWEEKYRHIIKLGRELPPMPAELHTEENKVRGCQSQVWLHADLRNGRVIFQGDSDAAIVKGLVALALRVYSNRTPQEIVAVAPDFIKKIGLDTHLSPNRTNGFASMIKKIKTYGIAFSVMQQQQ
jgi:cysteine desulfuration protein SufE